MKGKSSVALLFLFYPLAFSQQIDIIKYQAQQTTTSENNFTCCLGEYGVKQAYLYKSFYSFESSHLVNNSKEKDCEKIQKKLKDREDILAAYKDKQLLDYAKTNNMSVEKYDNAIWNLALWIKDCMPYEPGTLTDQQIEDFFNKPLEPGSSVTVMRADFDGTIKAPDPNKPDEWVVIIDQNGEKTSAYNLVRTKFINTHGKNVGNAFFEEAEAHEKSHQEFYKDNNFGETPAGFQNHEVWAYKASIESLNKSLKELECDKVRGSIDYNHNIKFNYGAFSQTVTITGSVPFEFEPYSGECDSKQKVIGDGNVSLTMTWSAEECVGSGSSSNKVGLKGELIEEDEEKYIEMNFDEQWLQSMPITVTCDEETETKNMPVPPPTNYGQMKFKLKDGDNITRQFSGMGGSGTYSWTIRLPNSER
jgi:hypothetical protein